MGGPVENPSLIDEEKDKENSPPPIPKTPVSEKPNQTTMLGRILPFAFGTTIKIVPDHVRGNLSELYIKLLLWMYCNKN